MLNTELRVIAISYVSIVIWFVRTTIGTRNKGNAREQTHKAQTANDWLPKLNLESDPARQVAAVSTIRGRRMTQLNKPAAALHRLSE